MIGIIGALKKETDAIKELLTDKTVETQIGLEFNIGYIGKTKVAVVTSGNGKVSAALCVQVMVTRYAPELIINVGIAGSLNKDLKICDIIVADRVVQHDVDTSALGDPIGMISGIDMVYFDADKEFNQKVHKCANKLGLRTVSGIVASGDQFIHLPEEKAKIVKNFNADACEMEGAAVGHACFVNKTPFCVLRSISDAEGGVTDYNQFCLAAAAQTVKLIEGLLG